MIFSTDYLLVFLPSAGQFWNIPVFVDKYEGGLKPDIPNPNDFYALTVVPPEDLSSIRYFLAEVYSRTWDKRDIECLYAGNAQGGSAGDAVGTGPLPDDSVIEGRYKDYQVDGVFATDWMYAQFNEVEACSAPDPDVPQ